MNIDRNAPVGVFDSGIGGLTVAREIMRNLPSEKIVYFGDTARVPYGSKSRETVIRYSRQIIHFLQEQKVKAIVVACNTASAFALDAVRDELDIPIIGVIESGARIAAQETKNKRVGIIGTVGTVGSGIHASYLKELDPEISGMVISAQGGDSPKVQAEISQAMEALFGLEAHKIKVLKRVE